MRLVTTTIVLLCASFAAYAQSTEKKQLSVEDEVRFAILSKILGPWVQGKENKRTVCIAVDNSNDPEAELLARLIELEKAVKARSGCFLDRDEGDSAKDSSTGKPGVILSVSKLKWLDKERVEVNAGSYLGNMGSDGCKYLLQLKDAKWKIVSEDECFIS